MENEKLNEKKAKQQKPQKQKAPAKKEASQKADKTSRNAIRLSTKICINIGVIAVICLSLMAYFQNRDSVDLNERSAINNIHTALDAQDMIIEQFITDSENSMKQYGAAHLLFTLMQDPDNPELQADAQAYTEEFYATLPGWEGVYASNPMTTVLVHSNPSAIGMTTRKPEDLEGYFAPCHAADDGLYDGGVFLSPASGKFILNLRQTIYDENHELIGFVGGGPFISSIGEKLSKYSISGLDNVAYTIVDNEKNLYVLDPSESNIGETVEDELYLNIIEQVNAGTLVGEVETEDELICYKKFDKSPLVLTATVPKDDVNKLVNALSERLIMYCVGTLILILAGIVYVSNSSTRPLRKLARETERIADGYIEKPINVKCYVKETLQIKEASVKLQNALKDLRYQLKDTANSLSDSAHLTHTICASSEDSTEFISTAMEGLTQSVNSMENSVNMLKDEMSDIEDNVSHIGSSINSLSESSDSMDKISEQAMADINEVYTSSEKSVVAANEISEKMSELNGAIEEVSKASEIIASISSQTSLLSLNASIEAARAGEMGKGFAVVADEIGKLAAQSDQSTKQIDTVITRMQELAKISVDAAENIKDIILNEQDIVKQTQNSFTELKGQIDGSIEQIAQISEANTRLTMSKDSAIQSVESLAAISQENASSNEKVNSSLTGLNENVETLYGKTEDMTQMADALESVISVFKDED